MPRVNEAIEHALSLWLKDDKKQIRIGGYPLAHAVEIAGTTPVYLIDRNIVRDTVQRVRDALPSAVSLLYSVKANPHSGVVALMAELCDGFDIASENELTVVLNHAHVPAFIQYSGPAKTVSAIRRAILVNAYINVESLSQLFLVSEIGKNVGISPRICLRVNPSELPGGSGLRMTGRPSQFGISSSEIPHIIRECQALNLEPTGLHFYWGTQCLDSQAIVEIQQMAWSEAKGWISDFGLKLEHLNLGGGFGIPYFPNDKALALAPIARGLQYITEEFEKSCPKGKICLELGRYLVGEAGIYVTTIVDVKDSMGKCIAVSDGGLHHHLSATGQLGQGLPRDFPCILPLRLDEDPIEKVTVTGCLCTPIDTLARGAWLPKIREGDLFAILQSGAYGASASPTGFLSHSPAKELIL